MTLPPSNGQLDVLVTLRIEPSERWPWDVRLRRVYKAFARYGCRVLDHRPVAAAGQQDALAAHADGAGGTDGR